ncbi:MAG TPA: flagellar export chaperone FliS [Burkholderiales bacterium]|nr:flagellar export chaperone FliS [Burkholderiales bacterium]
MNSQIGRALAAYTRTDLETRIESATPEQLIVMLYEGAINAMYTAKSAFASGNIGVRGEAISKAIAIIDDGLRAALNLEAGGELAENLSNLYEYISNRLLYANLKTHEPSVDEALKLMIDLRQAWEQLERGGRSAGSSQSAPDLTRQAALSYGRV